MYKKLPHTIECLSFEPKCSQYILYIVQPTFSVSVYLLCYLLVPTEAYLLVPTCPAVFNGKKTLGTKCASNSFPGPLDLTTNQPIWRNVHIRIPSQETVLSCCLVVMTRTSLILLTMIYSVWFAFCHYENRYSQNAVTDSVENASNITWQGLLYTSSDFRVWLWKLIVSAEHRTVIHTS